MTKVRLPDWPRQIVSGLAKRRGMRVWAIGGVVRDALLGRPLHDWDFATDGDALGLARCVADALGGAYFPLDEKRSTGRAIVRGPDGAKVDLDFAALRGNSLEADLLARDFSINAMALSAADELVDPTGGRDDLTARRLRATSDQTFEDDPVRLMRAVRLESELDCRIDPSTEALAVRDARLLGNASAERLRDELVRLVVPPGAGIPLQRLETLGLLPHVLPELVYTGLDSDSPPHRLHVWHHALDTLDVMEAMLDTAQGHEALLAAQTGLPPTVVADVTAPLRRFSESVAHHLATKVSSGRDRMLLLKLSSLLHDIGSTQPGYSMGDERPRPQRSAATGALLAAARLRALRFSADETTRVRTIIRCQDQLSLVPRVEDISRRFVYRYFRASGTAGIDVALLSLADHLAAREPSLRPERWRSRLAAGQVLFMHYFERFRETVEPPRVVTGNDLMSKLGMVPGPEIGHLLEAVRESVAAGEVSSFQEAIALAAQIQETRSKDASESDPSEKRGVLTKG